MPDIGELQAKIKALSDAYAAQLPEKLEQIEQLWAGLPENSWDAPAFDTLHRMVHSITGSGRTFGFATLSDAARKLENYLKPLAEAKTLLSPAQRQPVAAMLADLRTAIGHKEASEVTGLVKYNRPGQDIGERQRVFLVEDNPELAELLRVQLSYFGYAVDVFHTLADFRLAMRDNPKVTVLMDVDFPEDSLGGIHLMQEIQQQRTVPQAVIFISSHEEFEVRLEAVRTGAIAYLTKPVQIVTLIDKLDALAAPLPETQNRVLVIDDSPTMTTLYGSVLEQAGLVVRVVNDPMQALAAMHEFLPDLILLDIYMPGCSGLELAKVIRQLDAFISVPIVFLSAEGDVDKQLIAMGLGGDDFLSKPIQPQHLVAAVTNRIRRSLSLRSFIVRDSLTGLLNHTAIKDQLDYEAAQARRRKTPLSFAMVDIDHFKEVNDAYGHPIGDHVIKSLARLLKQRLRKTDMVGRYGGEEFAVVLNDADGATAAKVMDAIRRDFAQLKHRAGDKEFAVSFSCGVADFAHFPDPAILCEAADRALYRAKHAGRNQLVVAERADESAA